MSESLSNSQSNTNNSEKSLENVIVSSETNKDPALTTISEKVASSVIEDPAATAAGLPPGWVSLSTKEGATKLANLLTKAALENK